MNATMIRVYPKQPSIVIAKDLNEMLELRFGVGRDSAEHDSIKQGVLDGEKSEFNPFFVPKGEDPRHFNWSKIKHHQQLYKQGYQFRQIEVKYD